MSSTVYNIGDIIVNKESGRAYTIINVWVDKEGTQRVEIEYYSKIYKHFTKRECLVDLLLANKGFIHYPVNR